MTPEQLKIAKRQYHRDIETVEDGLANAMLTTYEAVTGKQASERFREKIIDALRFDT